MQEKKYFRMPADLLRIRRALDVFKRDMEIAALPFNKTDRGNAG